MGLAILGMGTAVPATIFDQVEGLKIAKSLCCRTEEQTTWLPAMYHGTGIDKRHMVLPRPLVDDVLHGTKESASIFLPSGEANDSGPTTGQRMEVYAREAAPLAARAARQALARSGVAATGITHLVTVSCSGFYAPGVDCELVHALGLPPTVERTHLGFMGCHGSLNGLRVARAFGSADPQACVLLCAFELCSLHYHYGWDPGKVIANAIFADGAAALVGVSNASGPPKAWQLIATGSRLFPDTASAMTWTIGDHGFVMSLSRKVPGLIHDHLRPWLADWLGQHGLKLEDVASWAVHPGGPRILAAVEESLGLSRQQTEAAHAVFAAYGNMSSPTVLFILDQLRASQAPRPCVALGFGPGLTAEVALFA
jgi:predicted naringenin-chalcone synthase